jgi:hypothetical protein
VLNSSPALPRRRPRAIVRNCFEQIDAAVGTSDFIDIRIFYCRWIRVLGAGRKTLMQAISPTISRLLNGGQTIVRAEDNDSDFFLSCADH